MKVITHRELIAELRKKTRALRNDAQELRPEILEERYEEIRTLESQLGWIESDQRR